MRPILVASLLAAVLTGCGCSGKRRPGLQLLSAELLRDVPSGSAVLVRHDSAYIVGDDATGIYQVSLPNLGFRKLPLAGMPDSARRVPKERKQDYEASAFYDREGVPEIVAFGSGSKSPARDSLLRYPLYAAEQQQSFSAGGFYAGLRARLGIRAEQWNIEGAVIVGDNLYLFNRGTNSVIRCPAAQALDFIAGRTAAFPEPDARRVLLPRAGGREARFSGGAALSGGALLFCASVEDTDDWTRDGAVLGSFIGIYDTRSGKTRSVELLTGADGTRLAEKLESVDLLRRRADGRLELLAVADNDDGSTRLLRLLYDPAD